MNLRTVGRVQDSDPRRNVPARGRDEAIAVGVLKGNPKAGDCECDTNERKGACGDHDGICNKLAERAC